MAPNEGKVHKLLFKDTNSSSELDYNYLPRPIDRCVYFVILWFDLTRAFKTLHHANLLRIFNEKGLNRNIKNLSNISSALFRLQQRRTGSSKIYYTNSFRKHLFIGWKIIFRRERLNSSSMMNMMNNGSSPIFQTFYSLFLHFIFEISPRIQAKTVNFSLFFLLFFFNFYCPKTFSVYIPYRRYESV